ncbi:MAG: PBECR4 domain-containing protein [Bacillus sp. (in: Bacteria)]|nr:PBECR4 domain-containing protein [Bacillus sp. (in: firmicutes)]MCM1425173.1 PBECR4 domain-containing protein [Eubacterium sp.]
MKLTKEDARRRVLNCAKLYQHKLLNRKLLIIYRERQDNTIRYIEVVFYERNYQHLTGVELINKDGIVLHNQSMNFYRKCVENKLGLEEFQFKQDGTTQLKLAALPVLMDITKITKITGDYNNMRPYLVVDKVIGGVNFCLGLSKEDNVYVPSSALLEDIKKLTATPSQVLAILEKDMNADTYSIVKHVAKELNLRHLSMPDEIRDMIHLEDYTYKGQQ